MTSPPILAQINIYFMSQTIRKIGGGYLGNFQIIQGSIIINITHPFKPQIFFSRVSDQHMSQHLRQIADNTKQLYELICGLNDQKLNINGNDQLIILVDVGRKVKEYNIKLQKVDISSQEALKKRVSDLEKQLQRKQFQSRFYKEQYFFLLQHLQLKPNLEELERVYKRSVSQIFNESEIRFGKANSLYEKESNSTMSSISMKQSKVGSSQKMKQQLKCPNLHSLTNQVTIFPKYKCNICRKFISIGQLRYNCKPCDFDACKDCISVPPQNRKYCPKQHAMKFACAPNYMTRFCDVCKKSVAHKNAFTCLECQYDLCSKCSQ